MKKKVINFVHSINLGVRAKYSGNTKTLYLYGGKEQGDREHVEGDIIMKFGFGLPFRISTILILLLTISTITSAQKSRPMPSVDIPPARNTTTVSQQPAYTPAGGQHFDLDIKKPKTQEDCLKNSSQTSNTATYKNQQYQVYSSKNGKLFIIAPNKEGTGYYRKYIPQ